MNLEREYTLIIVVIIKVFFMTFDLRSYLLKMFLVLNFID
jgi:hypothetical protein